MILVSNGIPEQRELSVVEVCRALDRALQLATSYDFVRRYS
jgi:hypothetical protein